MDRDGTASGGVRDAHPHLSADRALRGEDQRGGQGQFLDVVAADLVARADRHLQQGRARQQDGAVDGVVGQPRVRVQ
ncbi:hypothetical protein TNCT6_07960 [Streptomyces sp. 6-11-2]|nr:hypothetical protein TNCT6_07960 [Streptomyces sp. 6-11-2]